MSRAKQLLYLMALCAFAQPAGAFTSVYTGVAAQSPYQEYYVTPVEDQKWSSSETRLESSSERIAIGGFRDQAGRAVDGFGRSASYADLSTGKIGALAVSNDYMRAEAFGGFSDVVRFTIGGAQADTVTSLRLIFDLEGELDLTGNTAGQPPYADMVFRASLDQVNRPFGGVLADAIVVDRTDTGLYQWSNNFRAFHVLNYGNLRRVDATFDVIGPDPTVGFSMNMDVRAQSGAQADFFHTAALSLLLPQNVTFSSDSGVFLSQASAAPEPQAWTLMLGGFGVIGVTLRRRSRAIYG